MKKIAICAVTAVCFASSALLGNAVKSRPGPDSSEALLAADGPYRDGLYVGKFMRAEGRPLNPPIGRWSTDEERSAFLAGYERGFGENRNSDAKVF